MMNKFIALALITMMAATPAMAKSKKKSKPTPAPVVQVQPAPTPAPAPVAPKPSFMDQQIANALANSTRPVGVTTYGAAAALQSGGIDAAEAASAGF